MTVAGVRAARVRLPQGPRTWTVVDASGLPVGEVEQYLGWLRAVGRSVSTVRAYAHHLAHLYRWLAARGICWDQVDFDGLCDFMLALKAGLPPLAKRGGGEREASSAGAAASAVREFFEYHRIEGRGPADLRLSRTVAYSSRTAYHFLAHVERRRGVEVNRLSAGLQSRRPEIQVISFENDFVRLLEAASTGRDRLLLSACYDLGLRMGQSLGLRHGDLDPMRQQVRVERREDNLNEALSKRRGEFTVKAPRRFFDLYRSYLLGELMPAGIDCDYLFVNLRRHPVGRPLSYSNGRQLVTAIGDRAGIAGLHPHMLRHTHATALARAGWTGAEIAARLGHQHASSADVYIHLANDDLERRLAATQHLIWPDLPQAEPAP
jgi:integrase/recombinase XerD